MPELPDVEVFSRYLKRTGLHKKIEKVNVTEDRVLKDTSPQGLGRALKGRTLESLRRHGKYLFADMDNGKHLVFHFGMTGFFKYYKDESNKSDHARVIFDFVNGYHLAFDNQRMLGEIRVVKDADKFIEKENLGPDPYSKDFDLKTFREIMNNKRGSVKSALMNQKTLAGIGNVYSDEILFQAGIDPRSDVKKLSSQDLKTIYESMQYVFKKAIDAKAMREKMPNDFLTRHRNEGESCPKGSGKIRKYKFHGQRGAYYCPKHQKRKK